MIYTTAERLEHIASALDTISPEWSAQLKGIAQYIRGVESANFRLATDLREAQKTIEDVGNSISDAESEAMALFIREKHIQAEATANELMRLDDAELASADLPTYRTLEDLIESLSRIGQP